MGTHGLQYGFRCVGGMSAGWCSADGDGSGLSGGLAFVELLLNRYEEMFGWSLGVLRRAAIFASFRPGLQGDVHDSVLKLGVWLHIWVRRIDELDHYSVALTARIGGADAWRTDSF